MSKIAILLNEAIINDARVIRIIRTLCKDSLNFIDLFYEEATDKDHLLFSENVRLFPSIRKVDLKRKIIRHSFFYNEYLFFVKKVLLTKTKYDYIYANDLPCLKPAIILKQKLNAKVIYDSHEIYTETINQFFPYNSRGLKKIIFNLIIFFMRKVGVNTERKLLQKTDYFITVGEGVKLYFKKKYKIDDIIVLMNFPSNLIIAEAFNLKNLLKISQTDFLVIYQGMLNFGRGLFTMIESFKYTNPNVKLLILGDGPIKVDLIAFVKLNNLINNVFFLDKVNSSILLNYTTSADCGICLLESFNLSCEYAAPNKLFEYIHAGIPIIFTNTYESRIVFEKYNVGVLVENDSKLIAEKLNQLSEKNNDDYKNNCKDAAKEYNWEAQEKILLEITK